MVQKSDFLSSALPRTARTRVRLPDAMANATVFAGWGPTV
jgi:hypothetical protein